MITIETITAKTVGALGKKLKTYFKKFPMDPWTTRIDENGEKDGQWFAVMSRHATEDEIIKAEEYINTDIPF